MPTSQASCIEVYGLNQWRVGMASFAGVMLLIALVFWLCLWRAMDKQFRERRKLQDGLETFVATFCAVFHLASLKNWVMPPGDYYTAKSRKNGLRWGLSIAVYLLWAVPYAVLYVKAGNEFILPGLNPWPYEQVAGAVVRRVLPRAGTQVVTNQTARLARRASLSPSASSLARTSTRRTATTAS
ncbi:hypothetical protein DMC30DRAFT_296496 [Rhodotorula diobovata]|uniref:Uncharacterized protein n=1 Tax=Rhodotorula diobovata TaxID=5288 RepID=A0A5C5G5M6_9BASI|nr:hypothetical protein DMC30DRAFT_296496 [Rhodotorula diobovata]